MKIEEYLTEEADDRTLGMLKEFKNASPENNEEVLTVLYMTDLHYDNGRELCRGSLKKVKEIVEYSKMSNPDLIIIGGDITDGHSGIQDTIQNISGITSVLADSGAPVMICKGNHDSNFWYAYENGLTADNWISEEKWYSEVTEAFCQEFCFDSENKYGCYCYKDFPSKKIRVISLDTSDIPEVTDDDGKLIKEYCGLWCLGIREKQLKWLADVLKFDDEGWSVVFFSHNLPYCDKALNKSVVYNGNMAWEIIKAFKNKEKIKLCSNDKYFEVDMECDFTENKSSDVLAYFYGHMHADLCNTYDGITCICSKDAMNAVVESDDGTIYCASLKDIPVICNEPVKNNDKAYIAGGWDYININASCRTLTSCRFRIPEKNRNISLNAD